MRILFMGTPAIAEAALSALLAGEFPVVGAVCQPDRPFGRGMKMLPPPVKETALRANIPVFQPETLKNNAFLPVLEELAPDIIVVVAYGKLLPAYILDFPRFGCVNLHASLLPKYRGAAPVQRAVMAGEKVSGLSTMRLSLGMDEGDVYNRKEMPIGEDETAGELLERMSQAGGPFLMETLRQIAANTAVAVPQNHQEATYALMLHPADGKLPLHLPARQVYNHFRGVSPKPGAFVDLRGKKIKVFAMEVFEGEVPNEAPGAVFMPSKGRLCVAAGEGSAVTFLQLMPEGKKAVSAADFLNGRGVSQGEIFS